MSAAGYGANLCLAFNVGVIDTCASAAASDSAPMMQPLPEPPQEGNGYAAPTAKFDLSVDWAESECSGGDGSIAVSFESGIGPWPGIEDRFQHIISQILTTQLKLQAQSSPSTPILARIKVVKPQTRSKTLRNRIQWQSKLAMKVNVTLQYDRQINNIKSIRLETGSATLQHKFHLIWSYIDIVRRVGSVSKGIMDCRCRNAIPSEGVMNLAYSVGCDLSTFYETSSLVLRSNVAKTFGLERGLAGERR